MEFKSEAFLRVAGLVFCCEVFALIIAWLFYYLLRGDLNESFILPLAVFTVACSWLLWRWTNAFVLWLALMLSQFVTVFLSIPHNTHTAFVRTIALTFVLPALAYAACRFFRWPKGFAFSLFAACLCADLWLYARAGDFLYAQQRSPAAWGIDTTVHKPLWPQVRAVSPPEWESAADNQAMRYTELLQRQAYVLSVPMAARKNMAAGSFEAALMAPRWSTMVMPRHYFSLIQSSLPAAVMQEFFAVGKPLFQLKRGILSVPDHRLAPFFRNLKPKDAIHLTDCYAVLSPPLAKAWSQWSAPVEKAAALARTCKPLEFSYRMAGGINDFDLAYTAEQDGVLFWSDGYDSRWEALLDGQPVPIARADVAFKALAVPAGSHRLHFSFKPLDFQISLLLYYGTFALCLVLAAADLFWGRTKS